MDAKRTMHIMTVAACGLLLATAAHAADYWWNGTTNNYTSQNWESPSGTPTTATPGGWDSIYNTKGGQTLLTTSATPGYFRYASGELVIQGGGVLTPQGSGGGTIGSGPATITVDGGIYRGIGPLGPGAAGATVNIKAGTVTFSGANAGNVFRVSGGTTPAVVYHTGGDLNPVHGANNYSIVLGQQDTWSHGNGDYYFGDADGNAGTITGGGSLIVGNITFKMSGSGYQRTTYGTFVGHGTVGLTGTLRNNGYLIADGYGVERTLDLSSFTTIQNTVGNDEYKLTGDNNFYWGKGGTGWFAVNGGALLLPSIAIATGAGAYNWGESAGDTDIDLINAVRLDFADVTTGGDLSATLLATNRTEVADSTGTMLGIWQLSAPAVVFTTVAPIVRYDSVMAGDLGIVESDLKLYARPGPETPWTDITAGVDTTKKQITGGAITTLGMLAVGVDVHFQAPPAGTIFLVR